VVLTVRMLGSARDSGEDLVPIVRVEYEPASSL
jgi:hypothetical protein